MSYSIKKKLIVLGLSSIVATSLPIAMADILPAVDPSTIFHTTTNPEGTQLLIKNLWGSINKPYPTNAWFGDVALYDDQVQRTTKGSFPISVYPYVINALKNASNQDLGLGVGYSTQRELLNDQSWLSHIQPVINFLAADANNNPIVLNETIASPQNATPSLSVTLSWTAGDTKMVAPIVRGSPYTTVFYSNAKPMIKSTYVMELDGGKDGLSLKRHTITINDGPYKQTWILYSQVETSFKRLSDLRTLVSTSNMSNNVWIRVALQSDVMDDKVLGAHVESGDTSGALDKSARVIPLSGQVITTHSANDADAEIVNFKYDVIADDQDPSTPLLMTTLPHQTEILFQNKKSLVQSVAPGLQYRTMKGSATGVTLSVVNDGASKSASLGMRETLPAVALQDTTSLSDAQVKAIQSALRDDLNLKNPDGSSKVLNYKQWAKDAYYGGKELARAGRLVVIADQIQDTTNRDALLDSMKKYLTTYWIGVNASSNQCVLVYDTTFGGVIEDGKNCPDFGNYTYNDHHFHYGYFIYGLGVIAKFDPTWLKTNVPGQTYTPQQWTETLIRDYANPNINDPYLPRLRMQDDFDGHSWAEGLWATGDGKNQESISESVNAYYGLAVYGQAINNSDLETWGRFLLAREIRAAHHYWQLPKGSDDYSYKTKDGTEVGYQKDHLSMTLVWNGKAEDITFFGANPEYRYGIIMMPFTQISKVFLTKPWIDQFYSAKLKPLIPTLSDTSSWKWVNAKGAIFGATTAADQNQLWNMAAQSDAATYDDGDSKANTLYVMASAMSQPTPPPKDCNAPLISKPDADADVSKPIVLNWTKPTGATVTQYEIWNWNQSARISSVDGNTYRFPDASSIGNQGPFGYSMYSICGDEKSKTPVNVTVNRDQVSTLTYTIMVATVDKNTIVTTPAGKKDPSGNYVITPQLNSNVTITSNPSMPNQRTCTFKIGDDGHAQIPATSGCTGLVYVYDQAHKQHYLNLPSNF